MQGIDLFGYDIRLQTAEARRVRGVVLEANGKPAKHATITLLKPAIPRAVVINGRLQSIEPASQTGGGVSSPRKTARSSFLRSSKAIGRCEPTWEAPCRVAEPRN
jgi:hypothetical protein